MSLQAAEWLAIMREDPEEAARQLYRGYKKLLLGRALQLTRNHRETAEDLVQQTLVNATRSAHQLRGDGSDNLPAWLVVIQRNIWLSELKRKAARPPEDLVGEFQEGARLRHERLLAAAGVDATIASSDPVFREKVLVAIGRLPGQQRRVFLLRYEKDLSLAEIARECDIALGTAKTHLARARVALKRSVEAELYGAPELAISEAGGPERLRKRVEPSPRARARKRRGPQLAQDFAYDLTLTENDVLEAYREYGHNRVGGLVIRIRSLVYKTCVVDRQQPDFLRLAATRIVYTRRLSEMAAESLSHLHPQLLERFQSDCVQVEAHFGNDFAYNLRSSAPGPELEHSLTGGAESRFTGAGAT